MSDDNPKQLTPKQQRFAEEFLVDLNATAAAKRAGYSPRTAKQTGYENLTKPYIAEAIRRAMTERSLRTQITADEVIQRLCLLAWAELSNAAQWDNQGVKLLASDQLPAAERAAVRSVKMGDRGPELKLADPTPALRLLGEHTGAFRAEQQQLQMVQVRIVVDDKREVKPAR